MSSLLDVPEVPGANRLGHGHLFQKDRLPFLERIGQTADIARIRFLHRSVIFANEPGSAHEVLVESDLRSVRQMVVVEAGVIRVSRWPSFTRMPSGPGFQPAPSSSDFAFSRSNG